ncbi:MAG: hypothetical protein K2X46_06165 [Roseomonas sp.]|nr:hypothetical protein [Roseomonas sp.]
MASITAANSVFLISVRGLFPIPQRLQGYSSDAAFASDAVETAEVVMGVDGRMSAGYVPTVSRQTVTLMPDQGGDLIFDAWLSAQKAAGEIYFADGILTIPSISTTYILTRGVLTSIQPMVSAQKVLVARPFTLTWEGVSKVPL